MNLELQKAISSLTNFMESMYLWETKYFELYRQENGGPEKHAYSAKNDLKAIYEKYLTDKKKNHVAGRLSGPSAGFPPEFNPSFETIFSSELVGKKAIILTKWRHPTIESFIEDHRYIIVNKNNEWRIDKKEIFDYFKKKWVNRVL
jgi:hypothetical protein